MRTRMTLLYALPLLLLVAAVVLGVVHGPVSAQKRPLALPPVDAPDAGGPVCTSLLAALPPELAPEPGRLPRQSIAEPTPAGAVAWGTVNNGPVVLRCGLPRPAELVPGAPIVQVDGVGWLTLSQPDRDTFITVGRPVFVALTVPRGLGSGPVQAVSDVVRTAIPPS